MSEVTIFSSSCLFGILLLIVTLKFFHKLWWVPYRCQRFMESQGIKGPSYKLIYGNSKEIAKMEIEAASKPLSSFSHDIFPRIQPHIHLWTKLYGKNYIEWNGSQAQIIVTDPKLVKEIFNDKHGVFLKPKPSSFVFKILGDGIAMSRGEKWVKMRKLGNHAFHAERLKCMIPSMLSSCEEMISRLRRYEGRVVDVNNEFKLLSSDVISRTAFGSSYGEGQGIFESLIKLVVLASRNTVGLKALRMSKYRDHVQSVELEKRVRKSVLGIIKKREMKAMSEGEGFGSDFLGVLLKAHHEAEDEKKRISMEEIVQESKGLYFAGQETTNSLLAWTVFLLASNPNSQESARKEVLDLFGKQNPNPDGITKLKTMSMIINESLRLYPPAIVTLRTVEQNVRLGKLTIPAGTNIYLPILAIHHDPEIWGDDAHLFKPERFSEGIGKATKDNIAAFIPFGLGARTCLALNFALLEAKLALAMILQRYSFTLSPSYVHSPHKVLTLKPQFGVQVILNPLSEA